MLGFLGRRGKDLSDSAINPFLKFIKETPLPPLTPSGYLYAGPAAEKVGIPPVKPSETEGDATAQWFTTLNKHRLDSGLDPMPSIPVPGAIAPRIAQQRLSEVPDPSEFGTLYQLQSQAAEPTPVTPSTEQTFKELERFTGDMRPPMDEEGYVTLRNIYGDQVRGPDFAGEIKRATERHQAELKRVAEMQQAQLKEQEQHEKTEEWLVTQPEHIQRNVRLGILYEGYGLQRPSNLTPLPPNPTATDWDRLNEEMEIGLDNALRVKDIPVQDPVGEFIQLTEASGEIIGTGLEMGHSKYLRRVYSDYDKPLSDRAQKSRDAIADFLAGKKAFGETVDFLSENLGDRSWWQQMLLMGIEPIGLVATGAGWGKALQAITRSGMTAKQVRAARFANLVKRSRMAHRGAWEPSGQAMRMATSDLMDPVSLAAKYAVKRIDEEQVKFGKAIRSKVRGSEVGGPIDPSDYPYSRGLGPEDIRISDEAFAARAADEVPIADERMTFGMGTPESRYRYALEAPDSHPSLDRFLDEGVTDISTGSQVTANLFRVTRGNPDASVTIYRAVPEGVSSIGPGDWIALDRKYAEMHLRNPSDRIISREVTAKDISWARTSDDEWLFTPTARAADDVIQRTPGTQMVRQADGTLKEITPPELNLQVLEEGKVGKQLGGIQLENLAPLPQQIGRNILEGIQSTAEFAGRPVMKALGREVPKVSRAERRRKARELKGSWVNKYGTPAEKISAHKLIEAINAKYFLKSKLQREAEILIGRSKQVGRGIAAGRKAFQPTEGTGDFGKAYDAVKKALGGPLSEITLDPVKFRQILGEPAIDTITNLLAKKSSPILESGPNKLKFFDSLNAYNAWEGLLRGVIPAPHMVKILTDILGPGVGKALHSKRPRSKLIGSLTTGFHELINAPRALKASFDISFLGRQAGMMLPGEAVKAASAANIAMRAFAPGGEDVARELVQAMRTADNGRMWDMIVNKGGVFISDVVRGVDTSLTNREEAFMGSFVGKAVPYVRGSERAHATFLAKFRWDLMDDYLKRIETEMGRRLDDAESIRAQRPGITDEAIGVMRVQDQKLIKDYGDYINAMTGRGPMGKAPAALQSIVNGLMFSPKLFTSRIAAPAYAAKLLTRGGLRRYGVRGKDITKFKDPEDFYKLALQSDGEARAVYKQVTKMVARQLVGWYMTGMTTYWLAKQASDFIPDPVEEVGRWIPVPKLPTVEGMRGTVSGLRVGGDPTATDFGKIIFEGPGGQRTYDIWAGNVQIARAIAQLIERRAKSSRTGMTYKVGIAEVLKRLMRSKFNPTAGMILEYNLLGGFTGGESWGKGTGFLGEDRDLLKDMTAPLWKDGGLNEQSFWIRYGEPLFIRELIDSIDLELTPAFPGENQVDWNKNTASVTKDASPEVLDQIKDIGIGAATALPALGGIGYGAYTTPDIMTREMTKKDFGVELNYIDVPKFYREEVNEQLQKEELAKGVTREFSLAGRISKINSDEEEAYRTLEAYDPKLREDKFNKAQYNSAYFDINDRFDRQRQDEYAREGFTDDESERSKALRKEGLGKVELYAKQITEEVKRERERLEGISGGVPGEKRADIYERITTSYETSSDPYRRAALVWYIMDRYRVTIPGDLLGVLYESIREDYNNSKKYRDQYRSGALKRFHPVLYAPR